MLWSYATKEPLESMTFARRAKQCFDSCEQNVWTPPGAMPECNCCEFWDKFDSANFVQTFEISWASAIWALVLPRGRTFGKTSWRNKRSCQFLSYQAIRTAALHFGFNWRSLRSLLENLGDQEYAAAEGSRNIVDGAVIGVAESCRSMRLYDQSISLQRCWVRENALKSRCNHCLAEKFNRIEMQRHATKKLLGSMTFARRAKECFDSCEQNVWTDMFSCSAMSESNCCECWDKFDSANFVQTFEMSWTSAIWALVKFLRTSLLQRFRMLNWSCLGAGHLGKQVGGTKAAVTSYLIKLSERLPYVSDLTDDPCGRY